MSHKRSFSQATTQEDDSQSQGLIIYDRDMAYKTKRTKYSRPLRNNRTMVVRQNRVPRPIRTRGTPNGYYEIPVTVYRKLYFNMSTGIWETNPYTGVASGIQGYNGFGLATQLDQSVMLLGNGASSALVNVAVPGFNNIQSVFDECKIARIDYEFWVNGQAKENGTSLAFAPNVWIARDDNNIDPPGTLDAILQYNNIVSVKGDITRPTRLTVYPKVRQVLGAGETEAATTSTVAGDSPAGYIQCNKPGVMHFGLRGWFETQSTLADAYLGYLCIKETQIRRYKITK